MKVFFFSFFLFPFLFVSSVKAEIWGAVRPKLVLVIVIDQFRADYLSRYQGKFAKESGFNELMKTSAYFPYGEYDILQSMTGPGHATIMTGAYPYQMGIPVNAWYDQKTHSKMYCAEDKESGSEMSPKNLIGTTVGDELKNADIPSKNISIALKDRASIFLGGHRADLTLWFDETSKHWISSKHYLKEGKLPIWVEKINLSGALAKCNLAESCGIEITTQAVLAAIENENLGQGPGTDILTVSYSSHDYAGHKHGPNSNEIREMTLAEDKAIAHLLKAVDKKVKGRLKNALVVLTGDHGVGSKAEYLIGHGVESDVINEKELVEEIENVLNKNYGKPKEGNWIKFVADFNFYLDEQAVSDMKIEIGLIEKDVKNVLLKNKGFAHVITQQEYQKRQLPPEMFARQILKTYYPGRSGHVIGIVKPFYYDGIKSRASHLTGYSYDRTVPILFSGFGIKKGLYADKAEIVDIAPTISFLLAILPPALSEGKVLKSILKL